MGRTESRYIISDGQGDRAAWPGPPFLASQWGTDPFLAPTVPRHLIARGNYHYLLCDFNPHYTFHCFPSWAPVTCRGTPV